MFYIRVFEHLTWVLARNPVFYFRVFMHIKARNKTLSQTFCFVIGYPGYMHFHHSKIRPNIWSMTFDDLIRPSHWPTVCWVSQYFTWLHIFSVVSLIDLKINILSTFKIGTWLFCYLKCYFPDFKYCIPNSSLTYYFKP